MKKVFFISIVLFLMNVNLLSQSVDVQTAKSLGTLFLKNNTNLRNVDLELEYTSSTHKGETAFYVFTTPELFRTWQICKGNFEPYNTYNDTKMFPLMIRSKQAIKAVREQSYSLVCLNDNVHIRNYNQVMEDLKNAFDSILPEKSSFEL